MKSPCPANDSDQCNGNRKMAATENEEIPHTAITGRFVLDKYYLMSFCFIKNYSVSLLPVYDQ